MNISKLLALSLVCGLCASCSNEDIADNQGTTEGEAITFSAESQENASRAAVATSDTLQTNGFKLYANVVYSGSDKIEALMEAKELAYNEGTGKWSYSPIVWWPTESKSSVNFYAVCNTYSDAVSTVYGWDQKPHTLYKIHEDAMKQIDYLWAAPILNATSAEYVSSDVNFTFRHALCALNIKMKKANCTFSDGSHTWKTLKDALLALKPAIGGIYKNDYIQSFKISGAFPTYGEIDPDVVNIDNIWKYDMSTWNNTSYTLAVDTLADETSKEYPIYRDATTKDYLSTNRGKLMVFPCGDLNTTISINHIIECTNGDKYKLTATVTKKLTYEAEKDVTFNINYDAVNFFSTIEKVDESSSIGIDTGEGADGLHAKQQ